MASDAAGLRAAELASYSAEKLVNLLGNTYRRDDFEAVAHVLTARERRAAEAEADLEAFHAAHDKLEEELSKIHAKLKKFKASFSKIHTRLKKPARHAVPIQDQGKPADTALALVATLSIPVAQQSKRPVVEMVEANREKVVDDSVGQGKSLKRKADEVEIRSVSPVQISGELNEAIGVPPGYSPTPKFSPSSSLIYEKAGACSNSLLSQEIKISGKVSEGVPSVEGTSKTVALKEPTLLEEIGDQGRNTPSEVAQDQISGGSKDKFSDSIGMIVEETHGKLKESFSKIPAPLKETPDDTVSNMSIEVPQQSEQRGGGAAADVSNGKSLKRKADAVTPAEGSGNTVTLKAKEPTPLEETGEGRELNASIEATQDQGSLFTVPVQLVERFERATASKRGRGRGRERGRTASKEKKNKNVSGGSPSRGRGGRGRSNLLSGPRGLKRPSPLGAPGPRTVQKCAANLENAGNPSRNDGQANMNTASGHLILGTSLVMPTIRISNVSGAGLSSMCGMGSRKVTENLGKCVLNKADSVPVMNNDAEGTSHEEGADASTNSKDAGGASTEAGQPGRKH